MAPPLVSCNGLFVCAAMLSIHNFGRVKFVIYKIQKESEDKKDAKDDPESFYPLRIRKEKEFEMPFSAFE